MKALSFFALISKTVENEWGMIQASNRAITA